MILPATSEIANDRPILLSSTLRSRRLGTSTERNKVFAIRDKVTLTAYEEFSPVTLIGRAIGVFPLRLNLVSTDQVLFGASQRTLAYPLILLGLTLAHLACVPSMTGITENVVISTGNQSAENDTVGKVDPNQVVRIVNPMAISIVAVASRVNSLMKVRRYLPKIFATMNDVDRLSKLKTRKPGRTFKEVWLFVVLNLAIGLPSQIFSVLFVRGASTYLVGFWIFMDNFNDLTAVSSEFQFLALCCLLRSRFRLINLKLLEAKRWTESGKEVGERNDEAPEVLLSRQKFENGFRADDNASSSYVSILRVGHQRLCDALDRVNDVFQVQLLFSMCGCFLNLLFNIYFLLHTSYWNESYANAWDIRSLGRRDVNFMTHPLRNVSWAIYYVTRFVAIATMASRTTREAKKSLLHILKIRNASWDYATKEELSLFHDHITARRIQFSAAGFYDVDVSLISSAVATGSTYLVIMVQFLNK